MLPVTSAPVQVPSQQAFPACARINAAYSSTSWLFEQRGCR